MRSRDLARAKARASSLVMIFHSLLPSAVVYTTRIERHFMFSFRTILLDGGAVCCCLSRVTIEDEPSNLLLIPSYAQAPDGILQAKRHSGNALANNGMELLSFLFCEVVLVFSNPLLASIRQCCHLLQAFKHILYTLLPNQRINIVTVLTEVDVFSCEITHNFYRYRYFQLISTGVGTYLLH